MARHPREGGDRGAKCAVDEVRCGVPVREARNYFDFPELPWISAYAEVTGEQVTRTRGMFFR